MFKSTCIDNTQNHFYDSMFYFVILGFVGFIWCSSFKLILCHVHSPHMNMIPWGIFSLNLLFKMVKYLIRTTGIVNKSRMCGLLSIEWEEANSASEPQAPSFLSNSLSYKSYTCSACDSSCKIRYTRCKASKIKWKKKKNPLQVIIFIGSWWTNYINVTQEQFSSLPPFLSFSL